MERELWPELYQLVRKTGRQVHQKGVRYQPWAIALLVLWAALHDRPRSWACERKNWSTTRLQPLQLPSASVLTRRADSVGMGLFWRMLEQALRNSECHGLLSIVDAKPLFVGGCTKDPDARFGFGAGIRGKGYKLHTIWANRCLPEAWEITPLNQHESVVARRLVAQIDGGGYLLGDGNYDETPLHHLAGQRGYQLLTNDRRPNAGKGHRPVGAFGGAQSNYATRRLVRGCSHSAQPSSAGSATPPSLLAAWVRFPPGSVVEHASAPGSGSSS